jgi:DNA transformation protein
MLPWARLAFEAALRAANAKVKRASAAAKKPAAQKAAARRR